MKTIFQTAEIPIAVSVVTLLQVKKLRKPFLILFKKLLIWREKFPGARVFEGRVFFSSNGNRHLLFYNQCNGPTTLGVSFVSCKAQESRGSNINKKEIAAGITVKKSERSLIADI